MGFPILRDAVMLCTSSVPGSTFSVLHYPCLQSWLGLVMVITVRISRGCHLASPLLCCVSIHQEVFFTIMNVMKMKKKMETARDQLAEALYQKGLAMAEIESMKLKVGNGEDCIPRNGRWNFNKQLFTPIRIEQWEVVNFSAHCDTSHLSRELINCGRNKGLDVLFQVHWLTAMLTNFLFSMARDSIFSFINAADSDLYILNGKLRVMMKVRKNLNVAQQLWLTCLLTVFHLQFLKKLLNSRSRLQQRGSMLMLVCS
ncbi:Protein argonaute 16 [Camellia lanceoleosa]|nr:Protein argonaute 16 [Camellia lanceoleosa]